MKLHLIFAPIHADNKLTVVELGAGTNPPLGLLYLASYVKKKLQGIEVRVTDGLVEGYARTLKEVVSFNPDVVGISFLTPLALSAYDLINELKRIKPGLFVVAGGPHATALPREVLEKTDVDCVVMGEGEQTLSELIESLKVAKGGGSIKFENIDGLAYKREDKVIINRPRQFIQDLDALPFPDRDLVKVTSYKGWYVCKNLPETAMLFSRGCPYWCTFCSNAVWKSSRPALRLRSPKNIVDEMELLVTQYRIREIFDHSDEFNCDHDWAIEVCEELKKRRLNLSWKTQLRADNVSEALVQALAESGCWYVHLGFESGNQKTLDGIRKHIKLEEAVKTAALLKKYGIYVYGLFMLFNVWEEEGKLCFEDIKMTQNTLNFVRRLIDQRLVDYFSLSIATPYPGSRLYDIALKYDLIKGHLRQNWSAWVTDESFVMQLPGVSLKEQTWLQTKGSALRIRCILASGKINLRDIPLILLKGCRIIIDQIKGLIFRRSS